MKRCILVGAAVTAVAVLTGTGAWAQTESPSLTLSATVGQPVTGLVTLSPSGAPVRRFSPAVPGLTETDTCAAPNGVFTGAPCTATFAFAPAAVGSGSTIFTLAAGSLVTVRTSASAGKNSIVVTVDPVVTVTTPLKPGDQRTVKATAASGGAVSMTVDDGSAPVCSISGSGPWTLTAKSAGMCVMRGTINAPNYAPFSAVTTLTVGGAGAIPDRPKASQDSIRSTSIPASLTLRVPESLKLTGTSASDSEVSFVLTAATSLKVCTLHGILLTAREPGECFLQATTKSKPGWIPETQFYTITITK